MIFNNLFGDKVKIDAKRFYEVNNGVLKNPVAVSELQADGYTFWNVPIKEYLPAKHKITEQFEVVFCVEERKLYIVKQNTGVFRFMLNGKEISFNGSDFVSIRRSTVMGEIPIEYKENIED